MINSLDLLLVDDSTQILAVMKTMLSMYHFVGGIVTNSQPKQTLEMVENVKPDMVLLDINMPQKSGIEILKEIKQAYPLTKVMMVTSQSESHYQQVCKSLGADYFIDKASEFHLIPTILQEVAISKNAQLA